MNIAFPKCVPRRLAALLLLAAATAIAAPEDDRERVWSAPPDSTPQQVYHTATKEAAGAYRDALEECRSLHGADRTKCSHEAKASYDQELAEARASLHATVH